MTPTFGPTLSTILSITVVHNNFDDDLINNNHHFRDASISQHSALSRRSSESFVDTNMAQYFKKQSIRRYTLPSIINSLSNSTGQDHNNSTPVPQSPGSNPRFWEIGNRREDSSVQVAMEHVQFGL
ncbi:2506_t:CDS:2 [Entrophospora sp. SA101]|nr:12254_t:CDS:2 [Entrophospora sp. SA101]CAJ0840889.1 2506_t:CDS:2 [Entrophospora sp. SA101]CAJ0914263.1 935_t:CDS:2 [Entrophospora sp. SA101]CAJ0914274.1 939_t:CDS:2 [Entrophospora sp. SA101]